MSAEESPVQDLTEPVTETNGLDFPALVLHICQKLKTRRKNTKAVKRHMHLTITSPSGYSVTSGIMTK